MGLRPNLLTHAGRVLRAQPIAAEKHDRKHLLRLTGMVLFFGMLYGSALGTNGGVATSTLQQMLYSSIKLPLLLFASLALSLPSFFVVNTLLGLRDDFGDAVRAIASAQVGLTIVLASLAPFTLLWYVSLENYAVTVLFNAVIFAIASVSAQIILRKHYAPLIARNPIHRPLMWAWLLIYAFVGIQMGWVMRPFIGRPDMATHFFREDAWTNAYLAVLEKISQAFGG